MTRAQIHNIDNHLTTQLLEGSNRLTEHEQALLEFLCTDSIYSIKDDFDKGINSDLWVVENMAIADHEFNGVLYGTSPDESFPQAGGSSFIRSRINGWKPSHRATFQVRMAPTNDNWGAELGLVSEAPTTSHVRLITSSTLSRGKGSFGVATRSPDVSGWYVVSGSPYTEALTSITTRVSETAYAWTTFRVAVNEQGETRLWINGQNSNQVARNTDMLVNDGYHLWLYADRGNVAIDYIEAWQERTPL